MRPDNLLELFEIDPAKINLPRGIRSDPAPATRPLLIEFNEPSLSDTRRLDPARAVPVPDKPPSARHERSRPFGPLASIVLHLSPLLLLLSWPVPPQTIVPPIPVRLVIEQPPPSPPAPAKKPAPEVKPPPSQVASEDMGDPAAKSDKLAPEAQEPRETQVAAVRLPPKPAPPPELTSALPKPVPPAEAPFMPSEEIPVPPAETEPAPPKPPVKQNVVARLVPQPSAGRRAQYPGPAATRDEYLAYCTTLIGRMPSSFVAGRHGMTTLTFFIRDNGTITGITLTQSSGYPDIDSKVEQMVAAVRRFPPLPQWFQGPSMPVIYHHAFSH